MTKSLVAVHDGETSKMPIGGLMTPIVLFLALQTIENFNSFREATAHNELNSLMATGSLVFRVTKLLQYCCTAF